MQLYCIHQASEGLGRYKHLRYIESREIIMKNHCSDAQLAMMLSLAACGGSASTDTASSEAASSEAASSEAVSTEEAASADAAELTTVTPFRSLTMSTNAAFPV